MDGMDRDKAYHERILQEQQLLKPWPSVQFKDGSTPRWIKAQILQGPCRDTRNFALELMDN